MSAEQRCVPAVRTVRLRVAPSTNPGKIAAPAATTAVWDHAVAFYTDTFLDHPGVFDARKTRLVQRGPDAGTTKEVAWTDEDRLTWAEPVTVVTPTHPHIPTERDLDAVCPGCPMDLRRAAIHAASGAVQSYLSNVRRWDWHRPCRHPGLLARTPGGL